jgi:hypothetical protein
MKMQFFFQRMFVLLKTTTIHDYITSTAHVVIT